MSTCVALLRGINVVGRNVLPMKELRGILDGLGLLDVRTYIQSGNVVFRGGGSGDPELAERIAEAIDEARGFKPHVMLLGPGEIEEAIDRNPFPEGEGDPRTLHVGFLSSHPADPDLDALEGVRAESERFLLDGDRFYLHAPDGIGRSKLAAKAEKALGVPMTLRNWRTVLKLRSMAVDG